MDYFSESIRQYFERDKYSTELISKSYEDSDLLHFNKPRFDDNAEKYYMAEDNGSEAEIYSRESENSKRDISNDTTAQLSAQIMNFPYTKFNETISDEAPEKYIYDEYEIFKKIKEAYAACACKICKCLTETKITPRNDFCDCEPCKCKDCTLNNLKMNSANFQPSLGNKTCTGIDQIKSEMQGTKCDCKPCDCVECLQQRILIRPDYHARNTMEEIVRKTVPKSPLEQTSPQDNDPTHGSLIGINRLTNCKPATYLNDAYDAEKTKSCRWTARDETPRIMIGNSANISEYDSTTLKNDQKCVCSVCECIVCECNGNKLTNSVNTTPYKNINSRDSGATNSKFCEFNKCNYQSRFYNNQVTLQSLQHSECKCDICNCVQCKSDSKRKNRDCNCDQCCCDICEGGCKTPGDALYQIKKQISISRVLRDKNLTYEYNKYAQLLKSRAQLNLSPVTYEKTKFGNIYYVSNDNTNNSTNKILSQVQSTMTENNIDEIIRKDSDRKVAIQEKQMKCTQVDNAMKTGTRRRPYNRTPKNTAKKDSVSVLPSSASKGKPVTKSGKTRLHSFNPGCRSTQTTSKSSSSLLSYQNNGCCTHTISLPDANIVDDFATTTPGSRVHEIRKGSYQKKHDIYLCSEIKNYFNKTNAPEVICVSEHYNDDNKNIVEKFLFDTFDKYLTKNCDVENIKQVKADHENVHTTLRKARKFTRYLNKILQKYEKANSEFESVSEKLKKSHFIMINNENIDFNCQVCGNINRSHSDRKIQTNPNESILKHNPCCNPIGENAVAIKVKNNEKEPVVERVENVKSSGIFKKKKEQQTFKILLPNTYALINNAKQKEKYNDTKIIAKNIDKSPKRVDDLHDEPMDTTPLIKNFVANNPPLFQDTVEEPECHASEVKFNAFKDEANGPQYI